MFPYFLVEGLISAHRPANTLGMRLVLCQAHMSSHRPAKTLGMRLVFCQSHAEGLISSHHPAKTLGTRLVFCQPYMEGLISSHSPARHWVWGWFSSLQVCVRNIWHFMLSGLILWQVESCLGYALHWYTLCSCFLYHFQFLILHLMSHDHELQFFHLAKCHVKQLVGFTKSNGWH